MNDVLALKAVMWVALCAGVGVFFGAFGRVEPSPRPRSFLLSLAFAVGGGTGAYFLVRSEHLFWAFAASAVPAGVFTATVRDWLRARERLPRLVRAGLWLGALVAAGGTVVAAYQRGETVMAEQDERERRELLLKAELSNARHVWTAEAARGVAEATSGRLVAWLAGTPRIEIDAEYEQMLGDDAAREVPLRVAFLNDSFAALDAMSSREVSVSAWRVEVRDAADHVLRSWRVDDSKAEPLFPSQRRDFEVVWDGRDGGGALVAPGAYAYTLEVDTLGGGLSVKLPFEVVDVGEEEIVEVDPTTSYLQEQQRLMRWHQTLDEGLRNLQRMPSLPPR